jgi:hypothetical protein
VPLEPLDTTAISAITFVKGSRNFHQQYSLCCIQVAAAGRRLDAAAAATGSASSSSSSAAPATKKPRRVASHHDADFRGTDFDFVKLALGDDSYNKMQCRGYPVHVTVITVRCIRIACKAHHDRCSLETFFCNRRIHILLIYIM